MSVSMSVSTCVDEKELGLVMCCCSPTELDVHDKLCCETVTCCAIHHTGPRASLLASVCVASSPAMAWQTAPWWLT